MTSALTKKIGFKVFNMAITALVLLPFVISCSQQKDKVSDEEPKDYMVKYEVKGPRAGEKIIYSQDYGKCIATIIGNQKILSIKGDDGELYVVTIDINSNKGSKMKNPIYKGMLESLNAKTPKEFNMALLEKMGGKQLGEKEIAGNKCQEWEIMDGAQKTCITQDGIILQSTTIINDKQSGETATEVIRNSTGGVDACDTGDADIEEIDIGQMLKEQGIDAMPADKTPDSSSEENLQEMLDKNKPTEEQNNK